MDEKYIMDMSLRAHSPIKENRICVLDEIYNDITSKSLDYKTKMVMTSILKSSTNDMSIEVSKKAREILSKI